MANSSTPAPTRETPWSTAHLRPPSTAGRSPLGDRVGAPWRDVPERYGHWQSIYALFRSWQRAGVWRRVWITLLGFADTAGLIVGGTGSSPEPSVARIREIDGKPSHRERQRTGEEPEQQAGGRCRGRCSGPAQIRSP